MKIKHAEGEAYTALILSSLMPQADLTHQMCVVNRYKIHEANVSHINKKKLVCVVLGNTRNVRQVTRRSVRQTPKMNIGFILKWTHTYMHYTYVNTSNFNLIHIPCNGLFIEHLIQTNCIINNK